MNFHRFEARAREMWEEVPPEFLEGIDGLIVSADAERRPEHPDVYTLGECLTRSYPSDWQGPETLRSLLLLYHGSFAALARSRPEFDWEGELWETITHELRHHLESLAAEDTLEGVDYAMDHEHRRYAGEPFDPFYYRAGDKRDEGVYRVEGASYLELEMPVATGDAAAAAMSSATMAATVNMTFEWRGATYETPVPSTDADVLYLDVFFPEPATAEVLTLVLVRSQRWAEALSAMLKRQAPIVEEYEVDVRQM